MGRPLNTPARRAYRRQWMRTKREQDRTADSLFGTAVSITSQVWDWSTQAQHAYAYELAEQSKYTNHLGSTGNDIPIDGRRIAAVTKE